MTIDEFTSTVESIYKELPEIIRNKMTIFIEEEPTQEYKNALFGYWTNLTPDCFTLCYWGFKATNDFRREHIERVIKHEFEHKLIGASGARHSEHSDSSHI